MSEGESKALDSVLEQFGAQTDIFFSVNCHYQS